ncbi:hypothetical protein MBM_01287 [Drepanopeziza brunnea f. sp. 'multigermtubi' MB_m1]|uniref:Uncharacterized protein n=1 Tax=Marssonina brunnea f. sp. multigermtubi (strain MB_m1) TaxID=1072389 RepID=K1WSM5_MARBU|nr:uncharacterized protein MBM_01287 [Drepanopeziza brunnea f. sp. 'multigermtubi' MB_m1]EKD20605.1 hypothetical protein MBM_01287 [Drepanopeziza brunnea f. sp. 'multigermtubi' MB_m1]
MADWTKRDEGPSDLGLSNGGLSNINSPDPDWTGADAPSTSQTDATLLLRRPVIDLSPGSSSEIVTPTIALSLGSAASMEIFTAVDVAEVIALEQRIRLLAGSLTSDNVIQSATPTELVMTVGPPPTYDFVPEAPRDDIPHWKALNIIYSDNGPEESHCAVHHGPENENGAGVDGEKEPPVDVDKEEEVEEVDIDGHQFGIQPTAGIERRVTKPGTARSFTIVRLVGGTDKRGRTLEGESLITLRAPWFSVDIGDFLLDLSRQRSNVAHVRNYWGQERYIPRRMLQNVYQPWNMPARTRITDDGVPIPLGFLRQSSRAKDVVSTVPFEEGEAVMIMSEDGEDADSKQVVRVLDYERRAGELDVSLVDRAINIPWGILVDEEDLMAARLGLEEEEGGEASVKTPKIRARKRKKNQDCDMHDTGDRDGEDGGVETPIKKPRRKKAAKAK